MGLGVQLLGGMHRDESSGSLGWRRPDCGLEGKWVRMGVRRHGSQELGLKTRNAYDCNKRGTNRSRQGTYI